MFLRYHLLCEQPAVRSQRFFKMVRDETKTATDVFALLELRAAFQLVRDRGPVRLRRPYIQKLNLFCVKHTMPLLCVVWEPVLGRISVES